MYRPEIVATKEAWLANLHKGKLWTDADIRANRRTWVTALRSGRYQQTTDCLHDNEGFSCLGVACDISNTGCWEEDHCRFLYVTEEFGPSEITLPPPVRESLGLENKDHDAFLIYLAMLNDNDFTFEQIADAIETYFTREKVIPTAAEIKENREAWIAALRSGQYSQEQTYDNYLRINEDEASRFSFTGVACDISEVGDWMTNLPHDPDDNCLCIWPEERHAPYYVTPKGVSNHMMPPEVLTFLGINDDRDFLNHIGWCRYAGMSFNQIADDIEEYFARER